jgi:hypothetical protein
MRKTIGLLCAAALMLPVGVITAGAAGGASKTPTCATAKGTATFKPPLPKDAAKKVKAKLSAIGSIGKCVGGGVKSGKITFTQTSKPEPGNCQTLAEVKPTDKPTVGKLVIKWNNGKTSTAGKFTIKQTKSVVDASTTGKITAGLFKGKTIKGTTTYKLPAGACSTKNLAKLTYTNKKGTKFVVK